MRNKNEIKRHITNAAFHLPCGSANSAKTLFTVRGMYLQDALRKVVENADVAVIDKQPSMFPFCSMALGNFRHDP
jgi:cellulose biosynthesis protein BcsQ